MGVFTEIKWSGVGVIRWSQQLEDFLDAAKAQGVVFRLVRNTGTVLQDKLQRSLELFEAGGGELEQVVIDAPEVIGPVP